MIADLISGVKPRERAPSSLSCVCTVARSVPAHIARTAL